MLLVFRKGEFPETKYLATEDGESMTIVEVENKVCIKRKKSGGYQFSEK